MNEGFSGVLVSFWLTRSEGRFIDMCVNNLNINLFVILLIPPRVMGRHSTVMVMHYSTVYCNGDVVRIIFQRSNGGD